MFPGIPVQPASAGTQTTVSPPNILLIIVDDVGAESLSRYQSALGFPAGISSATTPTIDRLATNGVTFLNTWSNPTCTPTRAGIYSGLHTFNHGLSTPVDVDPSAGAESLEESLGSLGLDALPDLLPSSYASGLFGKWHVGGMSYPSTCSGTSSYYDSPRNLGWDTHHGSFEAIPTSYCDWETVVDGACPAAVTDYATDYAVEEATDWIETVKAKPWWATVAFNSAHDPLHYAGTCPFSACSAADCRSCFLGMIESVDDAIATLLDDLATMGELKDTVVIFVGDNGTQQTSRDDCDTDSSATPIYDDPYARGQWKGTVYQGGVNVPLIIADGCYLNYGKGSLKCPITRPSGIVSPGRNEDALAHTLDLFATIAQISGSTAAYGSRDSVSLRPYLRSSSASDVRSVLYTDGGSACAIRNKNFKLVVDPCTDLAGTCELFRLSSDPFETNDLAEGCDTMCPLTIDAAAALSNLQSELKALRGWTDPCVDFGP
jgi:arylsulfatase A-like enzyme